MDRPDVECFVSASDGISGFLKASATCSDPSPLGSSPASLAGAYGTVRYRICRTGYPVAGTQGLADGPPAGWAWNGSHPSCAEAHVCDHAPAAWCFGL